MMHSHIKGICEPYSKIMEMNSANNSRALELLGYHVFQNGKGIRQNHEKPDLHPIAIVW